jgi:hypothetical protein
MGALVADRSASRIEAAFVAAAVAAAAFAALGGWATVVLLADGRLRAALDGLVDHPWWLVYRGTAGPDAPAWAAGAAAAAALLAGALLLGGRGAAARSPELPAIAAGLFLLTVAFEPLRGAIALLEAAGRSVTLALFLSRAVCWARFAGLLSLLLVALHALEIREQRPVVLVPVALVAALAMAASVPVDRTTFLAQLVFRLGDEQGVWFVNLVIGALAPLSVAAAAFARRQPRLAGLAAAFVLLLASRDLLFFGIGPLRLGLSLGLLALGALALLGAIRRGYATPRETRTRATSADSSAR